VIARADSCGYFVDSGWSLTVGRKVAWSERVLRDLSLSFDAGDGIREIDQVRDGVVTRYRTGVWNRGLSTGSL
jgi:hypothetical protein